MALPSTMTEPSPAADRFDGRPIRCATVGVGRMGGHHARVYHQIAGAELVGVLDADASRCAAVADRFGVRAFADVDELIAAGVEAVTIATPTTSHRAIAERLLEAGVACLIEKPLAETSEAAQAIKLAAERTGTTLMVGHIERFNPVIRAVQAATRDGFRIRPRFIEVHRVSPMTFRSVDVSVVMDMMIHDLDVVLMLMDGAEPDEISACGVGVVTEHDDVVNARLTWRRPEGTCVANISTSRLALKTERVTRITGEQAYLKIDYANKSGVLIRRTANELQMQEVREQLRSGADLTSLDWNDLVNIEPLQVEDADMLTLEIEDFLDAVRTGRSPSIDAHAGFANVRTAERIIQSIRETMGV